MPYKNTHTHTNIYKYMTIDTYKHNTASQYDMIY
jgi:hypothetical protein